MIKDFWKRLAGVTAVFTVILAIMGGCRSKSKSEQAVITADTDTTFVDTRDGQTYRKISIGSQVWMAENLNFAAKGSKCYGNSPDSCAKYGRLFTWADAKTACPSGWHLPSDAEWTALENTVGGSQTAGKKLKSKTGWTNNGNGTDEYAFSALPGGNGNSDGNFDDAGYNGIWWSATEYSAEYAWDRYMYYSDEYVIRNYDDKTLLYSVRCVQKGNGHE